MGAKCHSRCPECDSRCLLEAVHVPLGVEHICSKHKVTHKWGGA